MAKGPDGALTRICGLVNEDLSEHLVVAVLEAAAQGLPCHWQPVMRARGNKLVSFVKIIAASGIRMDVKGWEQYATWE